MRKEYRYKRCCCNRMIPQVWRRLIPASWVIADYCPVCVELFATHNRSERAQLDAELKALCASKRARKAHKP